MNFALILFVLLVITGVFSAADRWLREVYRPGKKESIGQAEQGENCRRKRATKQVFRHGTAAHVGRAHHQDRHPIERPGGRFIRHRQPPEAK